MGGGVEEGEPGNQFQGLPAATSPFVSTLPYSGREPLISQFPHSPLYSFNKHRKGACVGDAEIRRHGLGSRSSQI